MTNIFGCGSVHYNMDFNSVIPLYICIIELIANFLCPIFFLDKIFIHFSFFSSIFVFARPILLTLSKTSGKA